MNITARFLAISSRGPASQEPNGSTMNKYELIIWWSHEDDAFLVEVPELPGCLADGATYEEALANAQVVISEWIETATSLGREIPAPRGRLQFA
jgi:predicted RNase H-like HicB family nuclease